MADARTAQQSTETTVYGTLADARVAQQSIEVTVYGTLADARIAQQTAETTIYGEASSARVAQQSAETSVFAIASDARVAQTTAEVTTFGNPAEYDGGTDGTGLDTTALAPGVCFDPPSAGKLTTTFPGYSPSPGIYKTPVQIGFVNNMTVAATPAGRAIMGWNDTSSYYVAVTSDPLQVFLDNVVSYADRRQALTFGSGVREASIWVNGCDLYCAIARQKVADLAGVVECYKADDVENPRVWTLRGTIDLEAYNGGGVEDISTMGKVVITPSGRWLLPFGAWIAYAASAPSDASALATSVDQGLNWTILVEHRRAPLFSGTTGPISDGIVVDSDTGYYYWFHYDGPVANQGFIYRSTDGGATWAIVKTDASNGWQFYTDDAAGKVYAAAMVGAGWNAYEMVDPANSSTYVDTGVQIINSAQGERQFQGIKMGQYMVIIDRNRVASGAGVSGWIVGRVQFGARGW